MPCKAARAVKASAEEETPTPKPSTSAYPLRYALGSLREYAEQAVAEKRRNRGGSATRYSREDGSGTETMQQKTPGGGSFL